MPDTPLRIALAEDDDNLRALVAEWLRLAGHAVTLVTNGRELMAHCRTAPIDVVVSDVRMPEVDGLTAAARLRREFNIPAVLMSGSWTAEERRHAAAVAAVTLDKPFRPLDLLVAVARAVAGDRPDRRARVLVADDSPDGLAERLAAGGHEVCVCPAAEAAAAAEIVRPHLILVDTRGAGWQAVRQVRAREWGRGVRIVAVGGWEEADRSAEAAAGCDAHFTRPVGTDEVLCLLTAGCGHG